MARPPHGAGANEKLEGREAIDLYWSQLSLNIQQLHLQSALLGREIAALDRLLRAVGRSSALDQASES